MDRATVDAYEREHERWIDRRAAPRFVDEAVRLDAVAAHGTWRADLGCGPGWHGPALAGGGPVVALDAATAMARRVRDHAPFAHPVVADLEALPFRPGCLGAGWARGSYQHLPAGRLPLALADLHRALQLDAPITVKVTSDRLPPEPWNDPIGPRHFARWSPERFAAVVVGAGFAVDSLDDDGAEWLTVRARRARTLADVVEPGMHLLVVGLNPSLYSADRGIGFARPGNRFWPALRAAGLARRTLDPLDALRTHRVGFSDLVKRATARASELEPDEYVEGAARVAGLVEWLTPDVVCFAGLSGYRSAIDRRASVGWQEQPFGGRPAYVMPNPSGINAHTNIDDLAHHLRAAATTQPAP